MKTKPLLLLFCLTSLFSEAQSSYFNRVDSLIADVFGADKNQLLRDSALLTENEKGRLSVFFYYDPRGGGLKAAHAKNHLLQKEVWFYYANDSLLRADHYYSVYALPDSFYFLKGKFI